MRLDVNGTLDTTFGKGGIDSTINFWAEYSSSAVALQPDGKIVVAGSVFNTTLGIGRLLPNGSPDSSFGTNGLVNTGFWSAWAYGSVSAVGVMPDGRIVAVGSTSTGLMIAVRMMPDGSPDTSFYHTGVVTTTGGENFGSGNAMLLQQDGKIIIAGATFGAHPGGDFALVRYDTDGTLDRSFGDTGVVNIDFDGSDAEATALCIANDGQLIITGVINSRFGLVRINSNGNIDSSFGNNGAITTTIQDGDDIPKGIAVQYDGKIVVVGWSYNSAMLGDDPTVARYIAEPPAAVKQVIYLSEYPVLYPNPSTGKLSINELSISHIINITAADITGQKIELSYKAPDDEIMVNHVPNGMYLFKISFDYRPPIVQKILIEN